MRAALTLRPQVVTDPVAALDWCEAHVKEPARLADTVVHANQIVRASSAANTGQWLRVSAWVALGAVYGAVLTLRIMRIR